MEDVARTIGDNRYRIYAYHQVEKELDDSVDGVDLTLSQLHHIAGILNDVRSGYYRKILNHPLKWSGEFAREVAREIRNGIPKIGL